MVDIALFKPETVILVQDEASLYLQATTTRVWAAQGQTPVVRLHPGRDKICLYGSLDLRSGQNIVMQATTMNSKTTVQYLQSLLDHYPDQPILLLWDKATWHRGPLIRDFLEANPRLEVIVFPTASPDLNPQEQVWKKARQQVSHNHSFRKLLDLADAFESFLTSTSFSSSFLSNFALHSFCPDFI